MRMVNAKASTNDPLKIQPCLHCQGGRKRLVSATLMTWLGDDLIMVPNFPTWVCDMCGHRNYDTHALAHLSILLNPDAGTPVESSGKSINPNLPSNTPPPA